MVNEMVQNSQLRAQSRSKRKKLGSNGYKRGYVFVVSQKALAQHNVFVQVKRRRRRRKSRRKWDRKSWMDSNRIEGFNALWALTKSFLYPILFMFVCILTRERERVDLASHISYLVSFVRFFFHRPTVPCHRRVRLVFGAFIPNICVGRSWFGRFLLSRYGSFQDCWLEPSNFSAEKERGDEGCTLLAPLCPIHTIDPLIDLTSVSNHPSCLALFYQLQSPPPPHPPSPPLPVPPLSYLTSSWIQMTWVSTFSWAFFSSRSDKAWKKFKAHEEEFSIDLMRRNHVLSSVVSWFFTRFESSHFQRRNDFAR